MPTTRLKVPDKNLFGLFKDQITAEEVSDARAEATKDIYRKIWDLVLTRKLPQNVIPFIAPLYVKAVAEAMIQEESSGNVTIIFAHAILSLIGDTVVLSPDVKEVIRKLCRVVEQRPFPTLYWARFVESRLDDPQLLKYVLAGCKRNKYFLTERIHSVTEKYRDVIFPGTTAKITVFGYSETVASVLSSLFAAKKMKVELFTPQLLLPKKGQAEGELLKTRLEKDNIKIEILDDDQALSKLKSAETNLLLMSSRVVGSTSEDNLEVISCRGGTEFATSARETGVPVGIVSGSYKVWPTEIYEKNRGKLKLESSAAETVDSIISADLISWIMTEHAVFKPEDFKQVYDLWFDYSGLPLGAMAIPFYSDKKGFRKWKTDIKNILRRGKGRINDIENMVYRFAELLDVMEHGEHLRIVAGHANRNFYEGVEDLIRDVKRKKEVKVSIVAGPELSVDNYNDSPVLRLGHDGVANLYVSPFLQRYHFKIFGAKVVQSESCHKPLQVARVEEYIDRYTIAKHIADFEDIVQGFCTPWKKGEDKFIKIKDEDVAD